jgi:hypothetical protein
LGQSARFTSIIFAEGKFFPNCHNSFITIRRNHEFSVIFDRPSRKRRATDTGASSSLRRAAARLPLGVAKTLPIRISLGGTSAPARSSAARISRRP